jgi:tetratricopeptide (TPR) repeat protein
MPRSSKQHRTRANRTLVKLKRYAEHCPQNFQGKVWLVEAELVASAGDMESALAKFKTSIDWARNQELIHEEALAWERAGYALLAMHRRDEAREFLEKASSIYSSWGAQAKVNQLESATF